MAPFTKYWWNRSEIEIVSALTHAEKLQPPLCQGSDDSLILDNVNLSMLSQDLADSASRQKIPYRKMLPYKAQITAGESLFDDLETIFDVETASEQVKSSHDLNEHIITQSEIESDTFKAEKSPYEPCSRLGLGTGNQYRAFRYELELYKKNCTSFPLYYKWLVYCSQDNELSVNSLLETALDLKEWFKNNAFKFEDAGAVIKIIKLGISPRRSHPVHKNGVSLDLKLGHSSSQKLFKELANMTLTGTFSNQGSKGTSLRFINRNFINLSCHMWMRFQK